MYQRNLKPRILQGLKDTPVVLINGARQSGKSTLAQELARERAAPVYNLDDTNVLATIKADPIGFVRRAGEGIVIDEVQKAPELFPAIKLSVDESRKPGRFILTGSANVLLLPRISDSLAGRMEIFTLNPLSQGEKNKLSEDFISTAFEAAFAQKPRVEAVAEVICNGGFPEVQGRADVERKQAWFAAYLNAILQKDVRDLANIEGLTEMPRLLKLLSSRTGALLNFSELSRTLALSNTTLKRYVSLLEATFIYQPLPAWTVNLGKRLIKSPKIHLLDTGLAAHLQGMTADRLQDDRTALGHMLESLVVNELRKQSGWSKTRVNLYHYRTSDGKEIDVLVENAAGEFVGIEIKASESITEKDFKTLKQFAQTTGDKFITGIVVYYGDKLLPFGDKHWAVPLSTVWSAT